MLKMGYNVTFICHTIIAIYCFLFTTRAHTHTLEWRSLELWYHLLNGYTY
jgi:hypothetical protein